MRVTIEHKEELKGHIKKTHAYFVNVSVDNRKACMRSNVGRSKRAKSWSSGAPTMTNLGAGPTTSECLTIARQLKRELTRRDALPSS